MAEVKSKFRNSGKGVVGVVVIGLDGKPEGIPVQPGAFCWLTEEEQVLTANAPANDSDNPFENGSLTLEVRGSEANTARKIGEDQEPAAPVAQPAAPAEPEPEDPSLADEEIEEVQAEADEVPSPGDAEELGAGEPVEGDPPVGQRAEHEEVAEVPAPEPEPAPTPEPPAAKPAPAKAPAPKAPPK